MTQNFERVANFIQTADAARMPDDALDWAALLLLDTAGIAAAAGPMQAGQIARETALSLYSTADPATRARMMFDGRTVSMAGAAYAAATQIDNLDGHDGFAPAKGHVGVAILPALAALMQQAPDMAGPEALAHVVTGYEIASRAGVALHGTACDYHTSGAWNTLGVVAIGARIRNMSRDQLRQAMGIAEYHGPRSQMMREIANPTMLHDGSGMGALIGISALILAERGFTGAPAVTIEETGAEPYWRDLGETWLVARQYVKPYPICRWAHAAIDAVRGLMMAHGIVAGDIAAIHINTFHEGACLYPSMPETTSQAQYSLHFAVAAQAVHGHIGLPQISGAGLSDPEVAALVNHITVSATEQHNALFPQHRTADVTITLTGGRRLDSGLVHARGGENTQLGRAEMLDKYDEFAVPALGKARATELKHRLLGLTDPSSRLARLAPLLLDPAG